MLARMAFIGFLVLAFARPILPSKNADSSSLSASQQVSIYLDNSFSLQNEQDNKRLLDLGGDVCTNNSRFISKIGYFSAFR